MAVFTRFAREGRISYGTIEDGEVAEMRGGLFEPLEHTGRHFPRSGVNLLAPCVPSKILAIGLNFKSHIGDWKLPESPAVFYKPVSSLQDPELPIAIPADAEDCHFEGELVVVIGRKVRRASRLEAEDAVFGVTCGNDVSERNWQKGAGKDVQWWRAKGCDTFAPLGPVIVTGLAYRDLALATRVNGETLQSQRTSDLIFDVPEIVRFVSQYVTLLPGDVIYTGTPGKTQRMFPGDVVEVEIEGIGVLRNPVTAA